jgi:DinB superfamily
MCRRATYRSRRVVVRRVFRTVRPGLRVRALSGARGLAGPAFARLCATADLMSAVSARRSISLSREKSIARDFPFSWASKSFAGSARLDPATNESLTRAFRMMPMHTIPWCSQTAAPFGLLGRLHFTSSTIAGSASRTMSRSLANVAPRQSGVFVMSPPTGPRLFMNSSSSEMECSLPAALQDYWPPNRRPTSLNDKDPVSSESSVPNRHVDRDALARRFDGAIADLEQALRSCPDGLWETPMWRVQTSDPWMWPAGETPPIPERTEESIQLFSGFCVIAYHCLWFLDFYLTTDPAGVQSPDYVRGGPQEQAMAADGAAPLPHPRYARDVLLRYLDHGRRRLHDRLASATDQELASTCPIGHPHAGKTLLELIEINLQHVQEHGGDMLAFVQRGAPLSQAESSIGR